VNRAYSILTEKSIKEDDDFVRIEGIATTPSPDRVDDIVDPLGAEFVLPMKLLLHHEHTQPVGNMIFAKPTAKGTPFKAEIPRVKEPGKVKDRVDEAIHSLKYNLISAVSIGFRPLEIEHLKSGGIKFTRWLWYELSLVTIPANAEAVIHTVKSLDRAMLLSALGRRSVGAGVPLVIPGASGSSTPATPRGAVKLIPRK
jgi:HK97 family phage prohead protease